MKSLSKKILMLALVMTVVGVAGWFGRKAYKKVTEYKLVARAGQYVKAKDYPNAGLCLRRALQINPFSVRANRAVAELLEAEGAPFGLSLGWRIRTAQLEPNNPTNRLA